MKVLVTGGRQLQNVELVVAKLGEFHEMFGITMIIHGGATGADSLAKFWAIASSIPEQGEPVPDESWQRLGGRAGNARNSLMLRKYKPDVVIAFPGGTGTTDMVTKARSAGIPTLITWSHKWADQLLELQHDLQQDV